MLHPLLFLGVVLIGFGVLELVLGPLIVRVAGMDAGFARLMVRMGATAVVLGLAIVGGAVGFGRL